MPTPDNQVTFTLRLPEPLRDDLRAAAEADYTSLNTIVVRACEAFLRGREETVESSDSAAPANISKRIARQWEECAKAGVLGTGYQVSATFRFPNFGDGPALLVEQQLEDTLEYLGARGIDVKLDKLGSICPSDLKDLLGYCCWPGSGEQCSDENCSGGPATTEEKATSGYIVTNPPGNTYNIYGVSLDQVREEIHRRDAQWNDGPEFAAPPEPDEPPADDHDWQTYTVRADQVKKGQRFYDELCWWRVTQVSIHPRGSDPFVSLQLSGDGGTKSTVAIRGRNEMVIVGDDRP